MIKKNCYVNIIFMNKRVSQMILLIQNRKMNYTTNEFHILNNKKCIILSCIVFRIYQMFKNFEYFFITMHISFKVYSKILKYILLIFRFYSLLIDKLYKI